MAQEAKRWIGQPLDMGADLRAEQTNARHVALILKHTGDIARASRAASYIQELFNRTLKAHVTEPIACREGCHHCCHSFVSATAPEILSLAGKIRALEHRAAAVGAMAEVVRAIPQSRREYTRNPCPLLEAGACSAYEIRPLACRTLLSRSLATCEGYYVRGENIDLDLAPGAATVRGRVEMILHAALLLAGLAPLYYELNHALAVAMAAEGAEARWLAGEALFDGVAVDRHEGGNAEFNKWVQVLVDAVRPVL